MTKFPSLVIMSIACVLLNIEAQSTTKTPSINLKPGGLKAATSFSTTQSTKLAKSRRQKAPKFPKYRDPQILNTKDLEILSQLFLDTTTTPFTKVILSTSKVLNELISSNSIITPSVYFDVHDFDFGLKLQNMKKIHLTDNYEPLYFIINTNENSSINFLVDVIRSTDYSSKVIVFSLTTHINPEEFYNEKSVYDVFLLTTIESKDEDEESRYGLYHVCRFCSDGEDKVSWINTWTSDDGFRQSLQLPKSFKNNFYNSQFNISTFSSIYSSLSTTHLHMQLLGIMLNASINYISRNFPTFREYFVDENMHLVGFTYSMNSIHFQLIDYTPYIYVSSMNIITHKPIQSLTWFAFVNVYDKLTWILIGIGGLVAGATLYFLRKYTNKKRQASIGDAYWTITQTILWDVISREDHHISVCLLKGTFMVMMVVIIGMYTGELAGSIVKPFNEAPMDSLGQLWKSQKKILIFAGLEKTYSEVWKDVPGIEERKYKFHTKPNEHPFITAMKLIEESPNEYVFFMARPVVGRFIKLGFLDKFRNHNFYISKEGFKVIHGAYMLPKKAYYQNAVAVSFARMHENGFMQYIFNKDSDSIRERIGNHTIPRESAMVQLEHLDGGFRLLAIGYATGLFVVVVRIIAEKLYITFKSYPVY